ncbi:MAG: sulfurtransferase [Halieaceae bacterium]|nr:sulfurtransferase [Halieaceae bacterium]
MTVAELETFEGRILDCRFSLADKSSGEREFVEGHIPGSVHLDLARDMAGPVAAHGGRHPLPAPADFAAALARCGVAIDTAVVLYDDSQGLFAARAWWMMRALGFREPRVLAGGWKAWTAAGGEIERGAASITACAPAPVAERWPGICGRDELSVRQGAGARLVDAREGPRYRGEIEPIDPVAGHIPGADNRPWKDLVDEHGVLLAPAALREVWGDLLEADELVVYCGSGVSACVNLMALAELGHPSAQLYPGSWSDYCSYL